MWVWSVFCFFPVAVNVPLESVSWRQLLRPWRRIICFPSIFNGGLNGSRGLPMKFRNHGHCAQFLETRANTRRSHKTHIVSYKPKKKKKKFRELIIWQMQPPFLLLFYLRGYSFPINKKRDYSVIKFGFS